MPVFQYTATDQNGAPSQGNFEAPSEEQAREQLAQYGLTVTQLQPVGSDADEPKQRASPDKKKKKGLLDLQIGGGPNNEDISIFTRQMSTLVQAGLPLLRSLEVMIKQQEKKPKFKAMLEAISEKVSNIPLIESLFIACRKQEDICCLGVPELNSVGVACV